MYECAVVHNECACVCVCVCDAGSLSAANGISH